MAITFDFDKLTLVGIDRVHAYSRADGSLLFILDQVKNGTISHESEVIYSEGKQGVRLDSFDRNKSAKFTCTNGYLVASALATQLGSEFTQATESDPYTVRKVEYIQVSKDNTTTVKTPENAVLDSIKFIYKANSDNTKGTAYTVAETASAEHFKVTAETITLPTGAFKAGDIVIVVCDQTVKVGKQMINAGDKYSDEVVLYVDMFMKDPCSSAQFLMQLQMPKAKLNGTFDIEAGDNPAEHSIEAETMLDACSIDKELYRIVMAS